MPRSFLVTSTHPGEGKSLLAASLAVELAAGGHRVLLVDGDLRHGKVHTMFGASPEPGLSDVLSCGISVADAIRHDPRTSVDYLPRGSGSSFLPLDGEQILDHANKLDRIVIFDGPPALATADPALLATLAERTLLVVRWGRTQRRALDLAAERLSMASRGEMAVVVNAVDPRRHALYGFRDSGLFTGKLRKYYFAKRP